MQKLINKKCEGRKTMLTKDIFNAGYDTILICVPTNLLQI